LRRISVIKAFKDLLREYGITIDDFIKAMEEENIDVYKELIDRLSVKSKDMISLIYSLPWRKACILLFIIQAFYIINVPGQYKGYLLDPPREVIMNGNKVKPIGLIYLIKYLNQII
jgi:hypothetical protein